MSVENPTGDHYFDVEVESWGLPIYDAKVWLVADYRLGFSESMGLVSYELQPVGTRPNPLNAGQVVKFQTTESFVQPRHNPSLGSKRTWGLADLPAERVSIVVHGSGGREIKRVYSNRFGPQFWDFDCLRNADRLAKWKRYSSIWRRYFGVNLLDRVLLSSVKPLWHKRRMKRAVAKQMRDIHRQAKAARKGQPVKVRE